MRPKPIPATDYEGGGGELAKFQVPAFMSRLQVIQHRVHGIPLPSERAAKGSPQQIYKERHERTYHMIERPAYLRQRH